MASANRSDMVTTVELFRCVVVCEGRDDQVLHNARLVFIGDRASYVEGFDDPTMEVKRIIPWDRIAQVVYP